MDLKKFVGKRETVPENKVPSGGQEDDLGSALLNFLVVYDTRGS